MEPGTLHPESWGDDTLVCMTEEQRLWYEKEQMPVMCFAPRQRLVLKAALRQEAALSETAKRRFSPRKISPWLPRYKHCASSSKQALQPLRWPI
jgi:hypothetical protein